MPDLGDILGTLEEVIPVLGTISGHPELGVLAQKLISIGESEVQRRQNMSGQTREQVLADAESTFMAARVENEKLKKLGHEGEV